MVVDVMMIAVMATTMLRAMRMERCDDGDKDNCSSL